MGEEDYLQLFVPKSDIEEVLRLCHAGKVAGHFGVTKTQDQVKRRFYWPIELLRKIFQTKFQAK